MLQPAFNLKTKNKTYESHTFKLLPPSISYGHFIKTALRKVPQMKPPKEYCKLIYSESFSQVS